MAEHHEKKLSRGVSQVDLAAALTSLPQEQDTIGRYTQEQLLALRPKDDKKNGVHPEVARTGSPPLEGVMTPPDLAAPAPPPPTPASPGTPPVPNEGILREQPNGYAPLVAEGEQKKKKKKKKSSGKNKKPPVTGFEGWSFCPGWERSILKDSQNSMPTPLSPQMSTRKRKICMTSEYPPVITDDF
jgi:hypothetical protein